MVDGAAMGDCESDVMRDIRGPCKVKSRSSDSGDDLSITRGVIRGESVPPCEGKVTASHCLARQYGPCEVRNGSSDSGDNFSITCEVKREESFYGPCEVLRGVLLSQHG